MCYHLKVEFLLLVQHLCIFSDNSFSPLVAENRKKESSSVKSEYPQLKPSGYYFKDSWRPLGGTVVHDFNESAAITQCLRNKVINMYGDSTVRQWFEYLIASVPGERLCVSFLFSQLLSCMLFLKQLSFIARDEGDKPAQS